MSYAGHHPVHAGLQNESVGNIYPLAIVGYGKGDLTTYVIENLVTGQCLGHPGRGPKQWLTAAAADNYIRNLHAIFGGVWEFKRPVYAGDNLVWPEQLVGTIRKVVEPKQEVAKAVADLAAYVAANPRPLTPREAYYAAAEQDIG